MVIILTLGLAIFTMYFLVKVAHDFATTKREMDAVDNANAEFGAAFIKIALKHYNLRNGDPNKISGTVVNLQREEDLLIERYLETITQSKNTLSHKGVTHLFIP